MKLFQRIFATFCAVIVCAIFVASFSFWLVQNTLAENQFNQRRTIETTLMSSIISAFNSRGDSGAREILSEWKNNPVSNAVYVITGDDKKRYFRPQHRQPVHRTRPHLCHQQSRIRFSPHRIRPFRRRIPLLH